METISLGCILVVMVTILPHCCKGYSFTTFETFSGSVWNDNEAQKALDNKNNSCYMSGREMESFWKVTLPDTVAVSKVILTGEYRGALMVRVGFDHSSTNHLEGHESNRPCRQLALTGEFNRQEFLCASEREGNVISVNGIATETNNLRLCGVEVVSM